MTRPKGFANPEYLLTLTAFLILVAVVVPPVLRVVHDRRDHRALGQVRDALARSRAAHKGGSPAYLQDLVTEGLLTELPAVHGGAHSGAAWVKNGDNPDDAGGWLYDAWPRPGHLEATVSVNCTHTDSRGVAWNSY